ncbi:MAG: hypothetical protein U1A77_24355 [Pirellulales bacterium]
MMDSKQPNGEHLERAAREPLQAAAARSAEAPSSHDDFQPYDLTASPGAAEFRFSLLEVMAVTLGVAVGLSVFRWFPYRIVTFGVGAAVVGGWLRLYLHEWEPRREVIAWVAFLGAYLGIVLSSLGR